jgi:acyl carrier protein
MDAFAHNQKQTKQISWIGVNWDAWQFEEKKTQNPTLGATVAKLAITPKEGMEAFQRVLSLHALPQIVVSTGDLQARIDQWITLKSLQEPEPAKNIASSLPHARSNLSNAYVAPRNALEQQIVDIWQTLLGIEPVGIHDNFFELGGHSLLAIQVISRLRKTFQVEVPIRSLFETPTVEV